MNWEFSELEQSAFSSLTLTRDLKEMRATVSTWHNWTSSPPPATKLQNGHKEKHRSLPKPTSRFSPGLQGYTYRLAIVPKNVSSLSTLNLNCKRSSLMVGAVKQLKNRFQRRRREMFLGRKTVSEIKWTFLICRAIFLLNYYRIHLNKGNN